VVRYGPLPSRVCHHPGEVASLDAYKAEELNGRSEPSRPEPIEQHVRLPTADDRFVTDGMHVRVVEQMPATQRPKPAAPSAGDAEPPQSM
jgi:hypothetical protein